MLWRVSGSTVLWWRCQRQASNPPSGCSRIAEQPRPRFAPSDIVKADVIGRIARRQDEFTEKWEELEVQTGRNGFNDLFGHIRMIYAREKAKRALLEEFKEHVLSVVATPEDLIEKSAEPYADSYLIAKSQQYVSTKNAEDVNRLLKWLNRIDNSDWLPPAILFLSQKITRNTFCGFWRYKVGAPGGLSAYLRKKRESTHRTLCRGYCFPASAAFKGCTCRQRRTDQG